MKPSRQLYAAPAGLIYACLSGMVGSAWPQSPRRHCQPPVDPSCVWVQGVLVEPSPKNFEHLVVNRPNAVQVSADCTLHVYDGRARTPERQHNVDYHRRRSTQRFAARARWCTMSTRRRRTRCMQSMASASSCPISSSPIGLGTSTRRARPGSSPCAELYSVQSGCVRSPSSSSFWRRKCSACNDILDTTSCMTGTPDVHRLHLIRPDAVVLHHTFPSYVPNRSRQVHCRSGRVPDLVQSGAR